MNGKNIKHAFLECLLSCAIWKSAGFPKDMPETCIHWYKLYGKIPAVLLAGKLSNPSDIFYSTMEKGDFSVGLPELMIFILKIALKEKFPQYYPFTQEQLNRLLSDVTIIEALDKVNDMSNVEGAFAKSINESENSTMNRGIIFTLHKKNLRFLPRVIELAQKSGICEMCIIKNPTVPPYLCEQY